MALMSNILVEVKMRQEMKLVEPIRALAIVTATLWAAPVYADSRLGGEGYGHMWNEGYHHGFFGGPMWFVAALLVVGVVVLIVRAVSDRHPKQGGGPKGGRSAMDILNERYAHGEIDDDEYQRRRKTLIP